MSLRIVVRLTIVMFTLIVNPTNLSSEKKERRNKDGTSVEHRPTKKNKTKTELKAGLKTKTRHQFKKDLALKKTGYPFNREVLCCSWKP